MRQTANNRSVTVRRLMAARLRRNGIRGGIIANQKMLGCE